MKMLYCFTVLEQCLTIPQKNKAKITFVRMKSCLTRSAHLISSAMRVYKICYYTNATGHVT